MQHYSRLTLTFSHSPYPAIFLILIKHPYFIQGLPISLVLLQAVPSPYTTLIHKIWEQTEKFNSIPVGPGAHMMPTCIEMSITVWAGCNMLLGQTY